MKYIILGAIQGLTEFLPISSSGHLVVFEHFLNVHLPGITFEVFLHLATLTAVVIYLWKDVIDIFHFKKYSFWEQPLVLIVIGTIPAGIVGMLFNDQIESLFETIKWVRYFFILNSAILLISRWSKGGREKITPLDAFLIGIGQSLAILPGISRSGTTITVALLLGIAPRKAFSFSFLLSLAAISGAALLQLKDIEHFALTPGYLTGFISALIFGLIAIIVLKRVVLVRKLHYFGYYTLALGIILLFF